MEVATNLMVKKNVTPKFTITELRDAITQFKCGVRGQSRPFYQLDQQLMWSGSSISIKVPVIHLDVFPPQIATALVKFKLTCVHLREFMITIPLLYITHFPTVNNS